MSKKSPKIFQFKIKLRGITPMIWRRVQISSTNTFGYLHGVALRAMGWDGGHLHEFIIYNPKKGYEDHIGSIEEDSYADYKIIDEDKICIDRYFSMTHKTARYTYDFGDNWEHDIVLEKILDVQEGVTYPICLAGKRACPPENCGGIWGYKNLIEIMANPDHDEYEEMIELYGEIEPEYFDYADVLFY